MNNVLRSVAVLALMALTSASTAQTPMTPVARAPAADITVTLLGTGNPRPSAERFGPSTLVEAGGRRLLIDAGRGATIRLLQVRQTRLLSDIDAVFLTHLHSDHVVGLPDLWLTGWIFGRARPLAVFGPPGTRSMSEHLTKAYEFDVTMRRDVDEGLPAAGAVIEATDVPPGVVFDRDGLKVTAFAVDHKPVTPAYGYRVDYRGRSVAFTGDTRFLPALVEHARGVDVLVHEVLSVEVERRRTLIQDPAVVQRIVDRHTSPEDAGRLFSLIKPRLAVYSHIVPSPTRPEDLIPPTRTTYSGPLEVGEDLMTVAIGNTVEVRRLMLK